MTPPIATPIIQPDPTRALYIVTRPLAALTLKGTARGADVTLPVGTMLEIDETAAELAEIPAERDYDGAARRGTVDAVHLLPNDVIQWVMIDVEQFRTRTKIERESL